MLQDKVSGILQHSVWDMEVGEGGGGLLSRRLEDGDPSQG